LLSGDYHIPVLRDDVIRYVVTTPAGIYVDGTLGGGGHAEAILEKIFPQGTLIGIDADHNAHTAAQQRLKRFQSQSIFVHDNAAHLQTILFELGYPSVHGVLFDLGISSYQIDTASRGFSFRSDEKLDMRFDRRQHLDAQVVLNTYSEKALADVLWKFGEEKMSRRIARALIAFRAITPIETTGHLTEVVQRTVGERFLTKTLARIFQAVRIEVNNELSNLETMLAAAVDALIPGGRIVVISYHSLEDRIVKQFFRQKSGVHGRQDPMPLRMQQEKPVVRILTKKPLVPTEDEIQQNSRARSAKLRVAEKC
jgi:16S rRNA (cytosine1402-N4)-methyltransferase